MTLLAASNSLAFKIWKLSHPLKYLGWFVIIALVASGWACVRWSDYPLLTPGRIGIAVLFAALTAAVGNRLVRIIRYKDTVRQIAIGVGMGILGWIAAAVHLLIFDRMYLRRGRLRRIEKLQGKPKVQTMGAAA
jgi:hypothetical protein